MPEAVSLDGPAAERQTVGDWSTWGRRLEAGAPARLTAPATGVLDGWARAVGGPGALRIEGAGGLRLALPLASDRPTRLQAVVPAGELRLTADTDVVLGGLGWAPADRAGRTVVVVAIDTLRADRLGAWGAARATPHLDALAATSLRASDATAPAPWTLPSMRGALTGHQPEEFDHARTLQAALQAAGWVTEAVVANPWLGAPHGLAEHWGSHTLASGAPADAQVDAALALLGQPTPRDRLLLVHLQDPHLPYREPEPFRSRWAGPRPEGLPEGFTGAELRALGRLPPSDARRRHIADRYDQNVAFVDQELGRLLAAVPDDAVVAVFSDHGEELWDHGGVEHGHALWRELLHVPLMVRAPGLAPATLAAPTTLLDLTPTLRALVGQPADPTSAGLDLRGPVPASRALVSGRLLYGPSGWSVREGRRVTWRDGGDWHTADMDDRWSPRGATSVERAATADALAERLGRPTPAALRVARPGVAPMTSSDPGATVTLTCTGGFSSVWAEPRPLVTRTPPQIDGTRLVLARRRGEAPTGEVFAVPADEDAACTLAVQGQAGGAEHSLELPELAEGDDAVRVGPRRRAATVDRQRSPQLDPPDGVAPSADADLQALGYVEPADAPPAPPDPPDPPDPPSDAAEPSR